VKLAAAALAVVGVALVVAALATAGGGGNSDDGDLGDTGGRVQVAETDRPPRGLEVWAAQGCGSCHTFRPANSHGVMAPDLTASLAGRDEAYIRTSIVAPSAEVAPNWGDMMPPDFAKRIAPDDLDALVAFLADGSSGR
jgi:mono/diheme cytochrome c family protein